MLPLIVAGAAALGSAISGGISSAQAAKRLKEGGAQARSDVEQYANKAAGYQQPYFDIGTQNAQTLSNMTNSGAFNVNPYNYQPTEQAPGAYQQGAFSFEQSPGYQFQLQQGLQGIQNSAAAQGGLLSGGTLKALQKYGTGLAAQDYGNAYNRYVQGQQLGAEIQNQAYNQFNTNRNFGAENTWNQYQAQNQQAANNFSRFNTLANMGVGAANNLSSIYGQAGGEIANADIGQANAGAAGIMGTGQAVQSGLNNIGQAAALSGMYGNQGTGYTPRQTQDLSGMGFKYNAANNGWQWNR